MEVRSSIVRNSDSYASLIRAVIVEMLAYIVKSCCLWGNHFRDALKLGCMNSIVADVKSTVISSIVIVFAGFEYADGMTVCIPVRFVLK